MRQCVIKIQKITEGVKSPQGFRVRVKRLFLESQVVCGCVSTKFLAIYYEA
jgi:hypothetical protein